MYNIISENEIAPYEYTKRIDYSEMYRFWLNGVHMLFKGLGFLQVWHKLSLGVKDERIMVVKGQGYLEGILLHLGHISA